MIGSGTGVRTGAGGCGPDAGSRRGRFRRASGAGPARPVRRPAGRLVHWGRLLLGGLLLAGGCGEAGEDPPRASESPEASGTPAAEPLRVAHFVPEGVSGTLTVTDARLQFAPCGASAPWSVEDATGGDIARIPGALERGEGPYPVHLVLDPPAGGEGARVTEIRSAFPEGWGCPDVLPDVELQARGNEPFWAVDVTGSAAFYRTPENVDGVEYGGGAWEETAEGWRFEALRDFVDGIAYLTVELRAERCHDTMSGAWHPFSARASIDGTDYEGCALEGRRVQR